MRTTQDLVQEAKEAALTVLRHNAKGPFQGLPRTAGWGYPEPYTRDLMISAFGILATRDKALTGVLRKVLETLARNQTPLGHIPSLVHESYDRGASDTTPLFLIALALYRRATGEDAFLKKEAAKALKWMEYQSPEDLVVVAQQPTSDWRDEQWVCGFGLYTNTLVYTYLRLYGHHERANLLRGLMDRFNVQGGMRHLRVRKGFPIRRKPYYAMWAYKMFGDERFDLLGNSLAILSGMAPLSRARRIVAFVEAQCVKLGGEGELALPLPPCLFPFIQPSDPDWRERYERFNRPGEYHNGGVWPFVCGFYVAALVAAGRPGLARRKFMALTSLVKPSRTAKVSWGFNEWFNARNGTPQGQDWQSWSAAMYLYAAACVEQGGTPFFEEVRGQG